MCSELSGLPISCATPAASSVSAVSFSLWIVSSVERRRLGDVAQDHRVADHFLLRRARALGRRRLETQRHDVEIQEAVLRIEDLHVAADDLSRSTSLSHSSPRSRSPSGCAHALLALQSEELARGAVEVIDAPVEVGDDDAFVDRVEDRLEKTLLVREPQQVALHFLRAHPPDAFDEFVEKAGVHAGSIRSVGGEVSSPRACDHSECRREKFGAPTIAPARIFGGLYALALPHFRCRDGAAAPVFVVGRNFYAVVQRQRGNGMAARVGCVGRIGRDRVADGRFVSACSRDAGHVGGWDILYGVWFGGLLSAGGSFSRA